MSKLQADFNKIEPLLVSQLLELENPIIPPSAVSPKTPSLFGVFVRTTGPLSTPDVDKKLNKDPLRNVHTGDLTAEEIAVLSHDAAVTHINGAAICRPLQL